MNDQINLRKEKYEKFLKILLQASSFTFQNPRPQLFSLPTDVILHILRQKQSPYVLLKLYQTCKYFFKKLSILLIHDCQCAATNVFSINGNYNFNEKILFWFYNKLSITRNTAILQRIFTCTLKKLSMERLIMTFAEFEYIVSESMIESFRLQLGDIVYPDGSFVPLNFIFEKLPYCVSFTFYRTNEIYSKTTLLAMNLLQFYKPFTQFNVSPFSISNDFDPFLLWKFIKNNIDCDGYVHVGLVFIKNENYPEIDANVKAAFKLVFPDWNGQLPKICITCKRNF